MVRFLHSPPDNNRCKVQKWLWLPSDMTPLHLFFNKCGHNIIRSLCVVANDNISVQIRMLIPNLEVQSVCRTGATRNIKSIDSLLLNLSPTLCSTMKICKQCNSSLAFSCFNKHSQTKDGYRSKCKECRRLEHIQYRKQNVVKFKEYEKARNKAGAFKNRDKVKKLACSSKYRSCKINATPTWLTEDHYSEILDFYIICKMFRIYTGVEYHVDHIIPLRGSLVCGLHVPWNLQILTSTENISKNNRLIESTLGPLT